MNVNKSFTIRYEWMEEIKKAAKHEGITVNKFIVLAMKERLEKVKQNEK